uniref:Minor capsid protein n=1 Tax=Dulem virus 36 TaxID=3145754 RepID=A0AAU8B0F8_9CAUD
MKSKTIFSLKTAEQVRESQTGDMLMQIRDMYIDLYKDIQKQLKKNKGVISNTQLLLLRRQILQSIEDIDEQLSSDIEDAMITTSRAVVEDTIEFLRKIGFEDKEVANAFYYVPDSIVRQIASGNVYQNGWTLSKAIWGHTKDFNSKLSTIISRGTAQGKSAYDIAKDLEKYVNPSQAKESRKIPFVDLKTGRKKTFYFGNVDYNAQRLARTMISHAYQQSFRMVNDKDPFVTEYVWHSSMQHGRTCKLCMERNGQHFKKEELPEDHPNGMCTYEAYIPYTMVEIGRMIGEWYNSPSGTFPELDEYVNTF